MRVSDLLNRVATTNQTNNTKINRMLLAVCVHFMSLFHATLYHNRSSFAHRCFFHNWEKNAYTVDSYKLEPSRNLNRHFECIANSEIRTKQYLFPSELLTLLTFSLYRIKKCQPTSSSGFYACFVFFKITVSIGTEHLFRI